MPHIDPWLLEQQRHEYIARLARGPSEGVVREQGETKVVDAVPTGSLPVSSAEVTDVAMRLELHAAAASGIEPKTKCAALKYCATVLRRHAEYIRRQVEHSTERQPEENPASETAPPQKTL